jgi:fructoselysine-6-P-deglycase FrlB-like protein
VVALVSALLGGITYGIMNAAGAYSDSQAEVVIETTADKHFSFLSLWLYLFSFLAILLNFFIYYKFSSGKKSLEKAL